MDVAFHFRGPLEKAPEVGAFVPDKFPKHQKPNLLHADAAIGLNSPQEIGATPGCEAMAASGVPKKVEDVPHALEHLTR